MPNESTEVALYDPSAMAVLREDGAVGAMVQAFNDMGMTQFQLNRLRVPAGGGTSWEVPTLEGSESLREIDVLIAWAKGNEKAWYRESYEDSGGGSPPDCSSHDGITGFGNRELTVDGDDAQSHSYRCGRPGQPGCCPWNEWGSKRGDRETNAKDCADLAFLFFFYGEARLPMFLVVPPTSVKAVLEYNIRLMNYGKAPDSVITRLSLERVDTRPPYSTIKLTPVGTLSDEDASKARAMSDAVKQTFAAFDPLTAEDTTPFEEEADTDDDV